MEEELEDKPLEQTRQGYRGAKRKASEGGVEERPWDLLAISSSPGWTLAGVSRPNMSLPSGRYGQLRGARGAKGGRKGGREGRRQ